MFKIYNVKDVKCYKKTSLTAMLILLRYKNN